MVRVAPPSLGLLLGIFQEAEKQAAARVDIDWETRYALHLEDLRAAVEWETSAEGDPYTAVDLTIAGIPLSMQLALLDECLARVDKALQLLSQTSDPAGEREMKLFARAECAFSATRLASERVKPLKK